MCAAQNDDQPARSVLVQAPARRVVGRERVAAGDEEPYDDVVRRLLVHLGHRQLPRVLAMSRDVLLHRVLQLPLPPGAGRLRAEPPHWRISLLRTPSAEIRSTSAEQGFSRCRVYFLRQGGYVFIGVCLFVCLFVS